MYIGTKSHRPDILKSHHSKTKPSLIIQNLKYSFSKKRHQILTLILIYVSGPYMVPDRISNQNITAR